MHELSLMADLLRKLDAIAREQHPGTALEGAQLQIDLSTDLSDPHAQDILLARVEVEG